ncbi:hypothetical protein SEUCBS140593_010407 [Sporothrix eucalyptigena]|uniref:Uncharacterized protein n=1 Tax=Sporothrix eucalyptigena TaxID=1812306 RepID=A0ABP0D1U3_9PEZI
MAPATGSSGHDTPAAADDGSMDALVRRVEEFQAANQMDVVNRLAVENARLVQSVAACHEALGGAIKLSKLVEQACGALHKALAAYAREDAAADQRWLAFWGIHTDSGLPLAPCPGGWI